MSTALAKSLITTIEASQAELAKYLPPHIGIERFVAQVKMALHRQPKLTACTPASVFEAVRTAADLGLDPSGTLGSAYLVPYKDECTLIPGYRGLIDLACRSGFVKSMNAWVIYEKDEFEPPYAGRIPKHKPYFPRPDDDPDPGRVVGAWARAKMANGAEECHVMPFAKLEAIRLKSPTVVYKKMSAPWWTHTDEMYRKCPIRALSKSLPLSPIHSSPEALAWRERFAKAVEIDDAEFEETASESAPEPAKTSKASAMKAKLGAPPPMSDADAAAARAAERGEPGAEG